MLQDSTNRLRINVTLFEFLRKEESLLILSIAVPISDFNVTCLPLSFTTTYCSRIIRPSNKT